MKKKCRRVATVTMTAGLTLCCLILFSGCSKSRQETKVNQVPTLYYKEELAAISLPAQPCAADEAGAEAEEKARITLYLQQAEQRERQACEELEAKIAEGIAQCADEALSRFVEDELRSGWNSMRCLFKDEWQESIFYGKRLMDCLRPYQLEQRCLEEIRHHCLSLIHTRVRLLSQIVCNSDIPADGKAALKRKILELKGVGELVKGSIFLKEEFADYYAEVPLAACIAKRQIGFIDVFDEADTLRLAGKTADEKALVASSGKRICEQATASLQGRLKSEGYASLREASDAGTARFYGEIRKMLELVNL